MKGPAMTATKTAKPLYSRTQILLHWAVFLLVVPQFLLHDAISSAWNSFTEGTVAPFDPLVAGHVISGGLILLLVVWRIVLRRNGAAPAGSGPLDMLAKATHGLLYLVLILMPISGSMAWFGGVEFSAAVHGLLRFALIALVGLHVVGALYHQFVLRDTVMTRMTKGGN